jgi:hypothetical protein
VARIGNPVLERDGLEQAVVVPPHDLRRRHGGEIGGPLMLAPHAEGLAEAEEDERAGEKGGEDAQKQQGRLAALAARSPRSVAVANHGSRRSRGQRHSSTRPCDKAATGARGFFAASGVVAHAVCDSPRQLEESIEGFDERRTID